ncbi:probable N-acetyltransferase HLS1 [Physcomitrium patens]|uniref:N-acetyltransferase domain-containing protein n=1 Tax=Physcomitrium patens TaxID=3218 RepID=A0A2K1INC5_PHYPA|nr:probable N-acetyltransferase HLS1 [Physcomitrium patens]PNR30785.1 hypothetical protein PHYPA_027101 [Physcomitrium patens]|eukprot:XP_024360635.1 probable N-acetyltransferase HLS1 [Physcomitrella patens]
MKMVSQVTPVEDRSNLHIIIRKYNEFDVKQLAAFDKRVEMGPAGSESLTFDWLGDPLCRVRHLPAFHMLVAEIGGEIVGVIRGSVKEVVCSQSAACSDKASIRKYARVGYLLGLRVCPRHRRIGIAFKLVQSMEEWCREQDVEYVYMATEKDNEASLKLFTERLSYRHFRTPGIFIQPVHVHDRRISSRIQLTKIAPDHAVALYSATMSTAEFFPKDIDAVLRNKLCEGTWIASFKESRLDEELNNFACEGGRGGKVVDASWAKGASWAMLSVWRSNDLFQCEYKNASWFKKTGAALSRLVDFCLPGCRVPSVPNFFHPFGVQFMFGLHCEGDGGPELLHSLCWHAHNLARKNDCKAVMSEVAPTDPAWNSIPHWKRLSSTEDIWCIKSLKEKVPSKPNFDWCHAPPQPVLFVDPREV